MSQDARYARLARLAWSRIQSMGMDPVESITRALVAAAGIERPLPLHLDSQPTALRRLVHAMWAEGRPLRVSALAEALGIHANAVRKGLAKLVARRCARRLERGLYDLLANAKPRSTRGRASVATARTPVEFVRRLGRATPRQLAAWQGISADAARQRLKAALLRGELIREAYGVYAPAPRHGAAA